MDGAVHVAGHYALTMMLMDKLKETAAQSGIEGRIMFTGSDAHRISYEGGINFEALTNPNLYVLEFYNLVCFSGVFMLNFLL